jgi:hypothetical protein
LRIFWSLYFWTQNWKTKDSGPKTCKKRDTSGPYCLILVM